MILSRHSLIHAVWGVHADIRSRSLDQYVVKIRNLFIKHTTALDAFRTIHGVEVGVLFREDAAETFKISMRSKGGIDVSEVRAGRKPGTRVMSVRAGACGIHTLLLERTAKA